MTNFVLAEFRDETDRRLTGPWNGVRRAVSEALAGARGRRMAVRLGACREPRRTWRRPTTSAASACGAPRRG